MHQCMWACIDTRSGIIMIKIVATTSKVLAPGYLSSFLKLKFKIIKVIRCLYLKDDSTLLNADCPCM